eukprot:TRINITY_DN1982_c2_g1_i1.p2 TRINITY_DN1982_c2_g1~~TRINITY_DN1982_c2_g1_i1.p2  ORF type:complete len:375 (-),score=41.18 TRINITY_DN1982_c2_g1_i1:1271-2338(-)
MSSCQRRSARLSRHSQVASSSGQRSQASTSKGSGIGSSTGSSCKRQRFTQQETPLSKQSLTDDHIHQNEVNIPKIQWTWQEEQEAERRVQYYVDKYSKSRELNQYRMANMEEEQLLTQALIRFILFHHTKDPSMPITRQKLCEVIKEALPTGGKSRNWLASHIIARVQRDFASLMGLELKYLQQEKYVLKSLLPRSLLKELVLDRRYDAMHGFMMVVLSIVKLNNDVISQEDLWMKLGKFGIKKEDQLPGIGAANSAVHSMVRKKFLREEKHQTQDGHEIVYRFGELVGQVEDGNGQISNIEISFDELNQFIDQVLQGGKKGREAELQSGVGASGNWLEDNIIRIEDDDDFQEEV